MRVDQGALADLAASVADGTPIDWSRAESRAEGSSRRLVSHLRLVESISSLYRSMPDDRALVDTATMVADGASIDWADAESRADNVNRPLVRHLRLVENIARIHRSIPVADPDLDVQPAGSDPMGPRWGHLVLLETVGEGTSCKVFRAWDANLHIEVALKLFHDEGGGTGARTRMLEEARRLARVRHRHVVQVYGADSRDSRVGLWMELVRGESLEQIVKARGAFGAREAALIGLDLCAALAAVHSAGLLHRDVKAQNVMRESGGRIVLMDFGTGEDLAGTNRLVGTPLYLAPEIFGGQNASVQSDLYSLGVLLFYLVTGRFPISAASMEDLARSHARRERRPLRDLRPDLPEAFVRVVEDAIDGDPGRRHRSAGDLERALRESLVLQPERQAAAPIVVADRPQRKTSARVGFAFVAAALVLALLVTGLIVWTSKPLVPGGVAVKSLAVLPLVPRSPSVSAELTDAITEQLISTMGQIDAIRTTSPGSTMPFKGSDRPQNEIAQILGVDAVLDGFLTAVEGRPGDRGLLRLDAQLIAAGSGGILWSGRFVRPRGEIAGLLADAARAVAAAIKVPLTNEEVSQFQQAKRTNPASEEAYLQGRLHLANYGPDPARRALASFQRALELDPNNAAAHAGAATAYVRLGDANVITQAEARVSALAEIRKALEGGQEIAEAYAASADVKFLYDWDWDGAERDYRRALDLNASYLHARDHYAQVLAARERFDEALQISEETLRIDPQSAEALVNHGMLLYYRKDFAAAGDVGRRVIAQEPNSAAGYILAGRVAEAEKRYADALTMMTKAQELSGNAAVNLRILVIRLQALAGQRQQAMQATSDLEQAAARGTLRVRPREWAYLYLGLGRTDAALDQFEAAVSDRDPALVWMTVDPRVDDLRGNPRFQVILQKLGLS